MGLSMHTAMVIKSRDDILCQAGGPDKGGKYVGWIMLDTDRWDPVVNTNPVYDTAEEAIAAMKALVKEIREMENVPGSLEKVLDKFIPDNKKGEIDAERKSN